MASILDTAPPLPMAPSGLGSSLDSTFGAFLLGAFFSSILYGLGVHQVYRYLRMYPSDTCFIRTLVLLNSILSTSQVIFSMHTSYHFLVTNFANPEALSKGVWSNNLMIVSGGLLTATSQIFFLRRVSLISLRYKVVTMFATAFIAVKLGSDLVLSIRGFQSQQISTFTGGSVLLLILGFASVSAANILVTVSLLLVMKHSPEASLRGRTTVVEWITLYIVNAGVLVLVFDLVSVILVVASQNSAYWIATSLITARLYMNTLLSVLNSRKLLVSRGVEVFEDSAFRRNIITRATRLAAIERWNVPQLPEEIPPKMVDVRITTEVEDDEGRTSRGGKQCDSKAMEL